MKHIKSVNEFFNIFKDESESNKIAKEFIKRLEKVKEHCPYEITEDWDGGPCSYSLGTKTYFVKFDDVEIKSSYTNHGYGELPSDLYIDGEKLDCDTKLAKRLFDVVKSIVEGKKKKESDDLKRKESEEKINRFRQNINPAADRL